MSDRLRVAWATWWAADLESGPGDESFKRCDFRELYRLLAERDRQVAEQAWDECAEWTHIAAYLKENNPHRVKDGGWRE